MSRHLNTSRRRRGTLSMELVFVLPILVMLMLGLFEFSMLFFARSEVVDACRAGARKATLPGVSAWDVEDAVLSTLSPRMRNGASVEVESGEYSGDPVLVSVRVPMSSAAPDLLWPVGFSLRGRDLISESRMTKE